MFLVTNNDQKLYLEIDDEIISQCHKVKLLGITLDSKLNFDKHILELYRKVSKKVSGFPGLRNYLVNRQANILYKTTVLAHLNYCPLIWMFFSQSCQ